MPSLSLPPLANLEDTAVYNLVVGKMEKGAVSFMVVAGILTALFKYCNVLCTENKQFQSGFLMGSSKES